MSKMKNVYNEDGTLLGVVYDFDGDGSIWDEAPMRKERIERYKKNPPKYKLELV